MRKQIIIALVLLGAVALAWRFAGFAAEGGKPARAGDSPFAGKAIVVYTNNDCGVREGVGAILEEAQVKQLGGRQFIIGRHAGGDDEILKGRTLWLPVESITEIVESDSVKDAKKVFEEMRNRPPVVQPVAPAGAVPVPPPPAGPQSGVE
jgi:hypothetical protein